MIRFEGRIAHQNQVLFASDWMTSVDENLDHFLSTPPPSTAIGLPAQVNPAVPKRAGAAATTGRTDAPPINRRAREVEVPPQFAPRIPRGEIFTVAQMAGMQPAGGRRRRRR